MQNSIFISLSAKKILWDVRESTEPTSVFYSISSGCPVYTGVICKSILH